MKYSFLIFLFLVSCSTNSIQKVKINNETIKTLSDIQEGVPSRYNYLILFVKTEENTLLKVNIELLREIYSARYKDKYKNFYLFLDSVLNKDLVIKISETENWFGSFKLNEDVLNKYNKVGKMFLEEKIKKNNNGSFVLTINNSKETELDTILYLFSQNGFFISRDGYTGRYLLDKEID